MTQLVQHWLFDLDGTLVHTAPDIARALNVLLAGRGLASVEIEQVARWVGTGSKALIRTALAAQQQTVSEADLCDLLAQYAADYEAHAVLDSVLYPAASATVQALAARGDQLAIVTNKLSAVARQVLRHFDLDAYFPVLIGGDDVAVGKPDPTPLLEACRRLNVAPTRCIMVGDSVNDVRAARAAGMRVIAVTYGYNHGQPISAAKPDRLVDSLAALL